MPEKKFLALQQKVLYSFFTPYFISRNMLELIPMHGLAKKLRPRLQGARVCNIRIVVNHNRG
jgi:hypothetical protein